MLHSPSYTDLSDSSNLEDARHDLNRCASDADCARWVAKWGRACIEALGPLLAAADDAERASLADLMRPDEYPEESVIAAARFAHREGYEQGFYDSRHPEGGPQKGIVVDEIDDLMVDDSWREIERDVLSEAA